MLSLFSSYYVMITVSYAWLLGDLLSPIVCSLVGNAHCTYLYPHDIRILRIQLFLSIHRLQDTVRLILSNLHLNYTLGLYLITQPFGLKDSYWHTDG